MGVKGTGGRNRKPNAIHVLRGNPGRRALNKHEPKFPEIIDVQPPSFLDDEARREWARLSPALCANKLLTEADCAVYAAYCAAWSDFQRASAMLTKHGDMLANGDMLYPSPYLKMKRDAEAAMVRWAREFGFSPQSRAGLNTSPQEENTSRVAKWKQKYAQ
ncbi:MAG TPA: phage terminase small subunit P27 family [Candidatus Hydrogenedentes bacterium]|nr:phage terminase small subunit P27 family [Candidatus Hydrogenedentota bacterium]